jgi:hypothetical protein
MNIDDGDMKLCLHRKHRSSPGVLLLRVPNNKDRYYRHHLTNDHRVAYQQNKLQPPHMIGLNVNNLDIHDTSNSSFSWQRYSDKIGQISPAPDMLYRNTYLEETKGEKSNRNNKHRSSSPRLKLNNSFSYFSTESSQQKYDIHQYRTIYDYIRDSIRQVEQQRNAKQENFSFRIKRPQNEDGTFRRVLGEKKPSAKTSLSRSSSTTIQTTSSLFSNDLKSPQSFVNYINYSRGFHSTTSN